MEHLFWNSHRKVRAFNLRRKQHFFPFLERGVGGVFLKKREKKCCFQRIDLWQVVTWDARKRSTSIWRPVRRDLPWVSERYELSDITGLPKKVRRSKRKVKFWQSASMLLNHFELFGMGCDPWLLRRNFTSADASGTRDMGQISTCQNFGTLKFRPLIRL